MPYTTIDVEQLLVKESGRIGPDIYRKTVDQSPWLKLVKQDAWPDEMGDSVSVLVYERSLPYNSDGTIKTNWTNLASSTAYTDGTTTVGSGNAIAPDGGTIQFGQTLRSYNLQHTSLNSPDISLNDLRFPLKRKEQLSNIMSILTESTSEVWIQRYRDEYTRLAQNKCTATTANSTSAGEDYALGIARLTDGNFPLPSSTGSENLELTQGMLDRIYLNLIRDGAGANAYDRVNGAPVFLAIMSPEASDSLIRANADIRQDFRWSDRVNELLAPLGVQRTYRNFHHLVDPFPPRWDVVSGVWVRRRPFVPVANDLGASRQGFKYELNADYLAAAYEDTVIFVPEVFTSLVPKPISAAGAMEFSPQNYRGEFTWRNIPDRTNNPDGTIGFFRAIFASGSKPVHPQQGYVIRHKRSSVSIA